jgi:hypothetical protein
MLGLGFDSPRRLHPDHRALVDHAGFFNDTLVIGSGADVALTHPERLADLLARGGWVARRVGAATAGVRAFITAPGPPLSSGSSTPARGR